MVQYEAGLNGASFEDRTGGGIPFLFALSPTTAKPPTAGFCQSKVFFEDSTPQGHPHDFGKASAEHPQSIPRASPSPKYILGKHPKSIRKASEKHPHDFGKHPFFFVFFKVVVFAVAPLQFARALHRACSASGPLAWLVLIVIAFSFEAVLLRSSLERRDQVTSCRSRDRQL